MKIFLSFRFTESDRDFVRKVNHYLVQQRPHTTFFWDEARPEGLWPEQLGIELDTSEGFVLFLGSEVGKVQRQELAAYQERWKGDGRMAVVRLPGASSPAELLVLIAGRSKIEAQVGQELECARQVFHDLGLDADWQHPTGLPDGYVFAYEKDIIDAFVRGKGKMPKEYVQRGCTPDWSKVEHNPFLTHLYANPLGEDILGSYRSEDAQIVVDARVLRSCGPSCADLTLPEAGPRGTLRFHPSEETLNVGILVSGGIAPGINAVINGIVERHMAYRGTTERQGTGFKRDNPNYRVEFYSYEQGFSGLLRADQRQRRVLNPDEVSSEATRAGSLIPTARAKELVGDDPGPLKKIVQRLDQDGIHILYVIGGDGSMRAAHALSNLARQSGCPTSIVGIPKTMDNDILWVWQSFGFLSAVERARESIVQLHTEVESNPRLCVMQLFGSDSGFVVSHAVLGSGVVELALIPEMDFHMKEVSTYIMAQLRRNRAKGRAHAMVVMAETAIPEDVLDYVDDEKIKLNDEEKEAVRQFVKDNRRVRGETPDALRTAGLKVVSRVLKAEIQAMDGDRGYWSSFRVLTSEPRHLIRTMTPSVSDVIYARRLGVLAVDNALAGYTDFMVSQWLTEYVLVPLKLVVVGRKRLPLKGIFWRSTIAKTGQPANLSRKKVAGQ